MNKFTKWIIVPMLCLAANFATAANIKDYPTVAVMEFGNKAITSRGLRGHDMAMATEYAIYQLSNCGWFDLIDYEQLSTIAKMHAINMSGMVDQGTAVQMGKVLGAQFMVIGNVTGLTTKENVAGVRAHNAKVGNAQHVVNANVSVRIVDIETGRIVAAGIGKGSSTSTMTEIGFTKYRTKENLRSKSISDTIINDVKDELITRNTSQRTKTKDTDNRTITDSQNNSYVQNDNMNFSDVTKNSGSSSSNRGGSAQDSSYINMQGRQSGNASSTHTNRGYEEETMNANQKINDNINHDIKTGYNHNEKYNQTGIQVDVETETNNSNWKEGGSSLSTSGGPAEGTVWGKNQDQTWDVTVWNDEAKYNMYSSGGEAHSDSTKIGVGVQDNTQTGNVVGGSAYDEDYNRKYTNQIDAQRQKMDNRTINNNSQYVDEQSLHGKAGSQSSYNDYVNDKFQNESKRNQDGSFTSNIQDNRSSQYVNKGDKSRDYSDDYQDSVATKANNSNSVRTEDKFITYDEVAENYSVVIGTAVVSDVQVRNAISKAVRDAIYGKTGLMTTLNNGKQLKIKTGF